MRILTVVGTRSSGKTTIITGLIKELISRGYKVGTIKSIFCPGFQMDKPGTNTFRHRTAGAAVIAARADHNTVLMYPDRLSTSDLLSHYRECDWVLCEGDYEIPCPRIVAAHAAEDARERINSLTFAVSGIIANQMTVLDQLPVINATDHIDDLADLCLRSVPECTDLSALDSALHGEDIALSRAWCTEGCHGHSAKKKGVVAVVDGHPLSLTPEQEQVLRTWASNPQ